MTSDERHILRGVVMALSTAQYKNRSQKHGTRSVCVPSRSTGDLGQGSGTVLECPSRRVQTAGRIGDEERPSRAAGAEHGCMSNIDESESAPPCDTVRAPGGPGPVPLLRG